MDIYAASDAGPVPGNTQLSREQRFVCVRISHPSESQLS
jgi:hypothetical protein